MTMFDAFQLIGGFILAIGYIPQIRQIIRTKSCKDLNLKTYIALTVGMGFMEIYAINLALSGAGTMFLVTNSISLFLVLFIALMIKCLSKRKSGGTKR